MKLKEEKIFNAIFEVVKDKEKTKDVIEAILNVYKKEAKDKGSIKVLTKEDIRNLKTERGGYTSATMIALMGTNKPTRGWKRRLVGKEILMQQYEAALKGRTIYA